MNPEVQRILNDPNYVPWRRANGDLFTTADGTFIVFRNSLRFHSRRLLGDWLRKPIRKNKF